MEWYNIVLEYLKVFLAWPVLGSAAIVLIIWWLRKPLDHLLRNISVRMPGGVEIQAQQARPDEAEKEGPETITLDAEQQQALHIFIQNLQDKLKLNAEQRDALERAAQEEIERVWGIARFWEFMYLGRYLVPHTQQVLLYVHNQQGQITREFLCTLWPRFNFGTEGEREAVLNALQTSGLLDQSGNILSVTDKGRSFLQFAGLIPSADRQ